MRNFFERICRSFDVESLHRGELVAQDYDANDLAQAIKKCCRANVKEFPDSGWN